MRIAYVSFMVTDQAKRKEKVCKHRCNHCNIAQVAGKRSQGNTRKNHGIKPECSLVSSQVNCNCYIMDGMFCFKNKLGNNRAWV